MNITTPLGGMTALAAAFAASLFGAQASVLISNAPTKHMTCSAGVCAPTAKKAVLNAADLAAMLANEDVKIVTGNGAVTITVMNSFSWVSAHRLTLDAQENVSFRAPVAVSGPGALTITTADGVPGGELIFFPGASVDFWDNSSSLIINGTDYTLESNIAALAAGITANPSGAYALAKNYNASPDGTYSSSPVQTSLTGTFEGLGHTIQNLSIHDTAGLYTAGLFADIGAGGSVRDIALTSVDISSDDEFVGSLAGEVEAGGMVANVSASGTVSTASGLVGINQGTIEDSSTDVTVINGVDDSGLVKANAGTILRCHATGPVTEIATGNGGGLVSSSSGTIQDSYATGSVSSPAGDEFSRQFTFVGGLVGRSDGPISGSFATGNVTVEGNDNGARGQNGFAAVGGLVGWLEYSTIADSYARGSVTFVRFNTVHNRAGGLVGEADTPVLRSYSTGLVSAKKAKIGGLAGTAPPSGMSDAYWDRETSGISSLARGADDPRHDPGITGLKTKQLKSGLPPGFDPSVWAEGQDINNGYPYLIANPPQ